MALRLMAEIGLDGSGFERGMRRIGQTAANNLKNFVVSAFGIYGIQAAIRKTVDVASDLVDESQRLNMTVEQLQLLRQAAKDGGTEMGALAAAFERLNVARSKALSGDKESLGAFAKLGIGTKALQSQTAASLFTGPIRQTVNSGNVEALAKPLRDILGRSFGQLVPVLATDFEELQTKMQRLGAFMDTKTAVQLDALGDNLSLISQIIVIQLGPAILKLAEGVLFLVGRIMQSIAFLAPIKSNLTHKTPEQIAEEHVKNVLRGKKPKTFGERVQEGMQKALEQEAKFDAMLKGMREQMAATAQRLQNPVPLFVEEEDPKKKRKKEDSPDALVRVGNFLGTGQNAILGIAERQLQVAREHLGVSKESLGVLKRLPIAQGSSEAFLP